MSGPVVHRVGGRGGDRGQGGLAGWIRRHPFASFYAVAVALSVGLWAYLVVMEVVAPNLYGPGVGVFARFQAYMAQLQASSPVFTQHRDSILVYLTVYAMLPLAAPFFFFPFAPTASALIVTGLGRGRAVVVALLGAFRPVRGSVGWRQALGLYAALAGLLVAMLALSMLYDALFVGGQRLPAMAKTWGLSDPTLFAVGWAMALFTNQGGLLEELGWRAYAWPVLVRKLGRPLPAAVLLGVAWALWHLPREIVPILSGQLGLVDLLLDQARFITMCVSMTLVAVVFVNLTGGSVWPAILIHGFFNFQALGFATGNNGVRGVGTVEPALFWVSAALITLLLVGRDLGWQRRLQIHGGDGRCDPANLWAPPRAAP